MTPASLKTAMTIAATVFGALALVPQLAAYQAAFTFLAGGLGAWAHGKRPGDMTEAQVVAAVSQKVQSE